MRFAYIILSLLSGLIGLALAYAYLVSITMAGRQGAPSVFWFLGFAFLSTAILSVAGGVMDPRKPTARWLIAGSGAAWIGCAVSIGVIVYRHNGAVLMEALLFAGLAALPGLLPLAALALSKWKFA